MSYRFYLKKLTPNELGYRRGRLATGQMFFISKFAADFFPPLSPEINNDSVMLKIKAQDTGETAYLNLVYHNDKHNVPGGTRDEYRIYLNNDIAPHPHVFEPDDIIILERLESGTYDLITHKPRSEKYDHFDHLITSSRMRGQHALVFSL